MTRSFWWRPLKEIINPRATVAQGFWLMFFVALAGFVTGVVVGSCK